MTELYQKYSKNIPTRDLIQTEKDKILSQISQLTKEESEDVFYLIYDDYIEWNAKHSDIPYDGVQLKKGIKFNLDKLPIRLKQILRRYLTDVFESQGFESENPVDDANCL